MAHTFVSTSGVVNFTAGTSEAFTPAVALAVGIRAVVVVAHDTSGTVTCTSVTDNGGNTYTRRGTDLLDSGDAYLFSTWEATITTGATIVTANYSASCGAHRVIVTQYTGLDSTVAALVVKAVTTTANAATDFYTSGTLTPGSQPGVLIGYYANGYNSVATAGTGFFDRGLATGTQQDRIEDKSITALTSVASTFSIASPLGGAYITIGIYIPDAAATPPSPTGWKKLLASLGHLARNVASFVASFTFADVGTAGWTIPVPTAVTGLPSTYTSLTQVGSRIFYVDSVAGNDTTAVPYFWNGSAIVDSAGSTTGAGSVAYGTDPLNPSGPILPFATYARCACKDSVDYTDNTTTTIAAWSMNPLRVGFPDWWLFKRGQTVDLYQDMRTFLNNTGRSATPVAYYTNGLRPAGGASLAAPGVVGAYGPLSAGRARFVNPLWNFIVLNGQPQFAFWFGLLFDGSSRDRAVRPVDWGIYSNFDLVHSAMYALGLGPGTPGWRMEDCHLYATTGINAQFAPTHTTPTSWLTGARNLVTDSYDPACNVLVEARKDTGVADQTFASNTTTKITWPTLTSGANFASDQYTTVAAADFYGWVLSDITADLGASGYVEIVPFVNGAEVVGNSIRFNTIGAGLSTYALHGAVYFGSVAAGAVLSIYFRTTNAPAGTITVKGNKFSRLVISQPAHSGCQGVYLQTSPGTQFNLTKQIVLRNGFGSNPVLQPNFLPNGTGLYHFDPYNHNWYMAGDADYANCHLDESVSMIGSAGDVFRTLCSMNKSFTYTGYISICPSHRDRAYTVTGGSYDDSVFQLFYSTLGGAHTGQGVYTGNGTVGFSIQRSIFSDAAMGGTIPNSVLTLYSSDTPYGALNQLSWTNDTTNTTISGNIIDALNATALPYREQNGQNFNLSQWNAPITGTIAAASVLTCTLTPGYTGTPTYQWKRCTAGEYNNVSGTNIAGATTNTYTQASGDIGTDAEGMSRSLLLCVVSGITYPTGVGISGTSVTSNVVVGPTSINATGFYVPFASSGTAGVPAASATTFTTNSNYASISAAASALSWPNQTASLGTYVQALGIAVPATDGMQEYYNTVIGSNPILTAMRRGQWDDRFEAKKMGNHVRAGRNMAVLP